MVNRVQGQCSRQHIDMPPNIDIVRCLHGRIGIQDYAVCELYNPKQENHGIFTYSVIPSVTAFSMVCMHEYASALQGVRDSIFNYYISQLRYGQVPLHYIMYTMQDTILKVEHSEDSLKMLFYYTEQMGLPITPILPNGALLFGRIRQNVECN